MAQFAGQPNIRNTYAQTARNLRSLQRYFLPSQQAIQTASEVITPQEQALFERMYRQYAPEFARTGVDINRISQVGNVGNDLAAIMGGGLDTLEALQGADIALNPELYAGRAATGQGYLDLLGAQNPSRLSGAELANTERGINRMNAQRGNTNVADATTTAAAAGEFGNALASKQQRFGQALSLFPSLSGSLTSNIDPLNATGRTGAQNPGVQQYTYNPSTAGQGAQFQQQAANTTNQVEQMRQQQSTMVQQGNEAWGGLIGPVCGCYIFKEHYGYPDVPQHIRWCRDFFYRQNPAVARGYYRMAHWSVPLMRKSRIIRWLITYSCIFPLAAYGRYLTGYSRWTKIFKPFRCFWINFWILTGQKYAN